MPITRSQISQAFARRSERAIGLGLALVNKRRPVTAVGYGTPAGFGSLHALIEHHFTAWSTPGHINRGSLTMALELLNAEPAVILETGSSAWGTNSSQLFDSYVASFGGCFQTVDVRIGPLMNLRPVVSSSTTLACGDSVQFLRHWVAQHPGDRTDLVYLDSWDLDANDPMPSAVHGLNEVLAILPAMNKGTLLLVDDSPAELELFAPRQIEAARAFRDLYGLVPGKGMLIELYLSQQPGVTKLHHGYQLLYQFD